MSHQELVTSNKSSAYVKVISRRIGRGVFARKAFSPGEIVLYFHGDILEAPYVNNFDLGLQVGHNQFMMSAGDIDDYVNHSCEPNTVLVFRETPLGEQWCLVAIQEINVQDHITFDYSITMEGGFWTMKCCCGSSRCRKLIDDFEKLPEEVQDELEQQRAFSGLSVV